MKFRKLPPVGSEITEHEGDLMDLMNAIPYLLVGRRLPPLRVLNSVFETGLNDAGMSGGAEWEPFTISSQEYDGLVAQCRQVQIAVTSCPEWVKNLEDFHIWEHQVTGGVHYKENRLLVDRADDAIDDLEEATVSGASEAEIERLNLKVIETRQALVDFLERVSDS